MENEFFEELYSYLSEEGMTDLGSEDFFNSYKNIEGEKFNELYSYLSDEGMTDLSKEDFNAKYFKLQNEPIIEKKNPDGTPIIPGGPNSPDSNSNFIAVEEDTESPIEAGGQPPSSDGGETIIEDDVISEDLEEEEVGEDFSKPLSIFDIDNDRDVKGAVQARYGETRTTEMGRLNLQGELNTAIERQFGYNGFTDFFGDMYRGWSTGATQGNAVDEFMALALKKSESVTNEEIAQFLEAQKRLEEQPESYEMQQFRRISDENGGGFTGMMIGFMDNFSFSSSSNSFRSSRFWSRCWYRSVIRYSNWAFSSYSIFYSIFVWWCVRSNRRGNRWSYYSSGRGIIFCRIF